MKKILGIIAVLALVAVPLLTNAATYRLGAKSLNFNQTASTTKTSAYTITSSDSLVNVTCSNANITITLPTVASTRPGTKSYKILKTDATTYKVVVTPATGDTIGGESTRYLTRQNDYMVISTGPGADWSVDFESPLVAEDYEAGTVTVDNITVNGTFTGSGAVSGTTGTFSGAVSGTTGTFTGVGTFGNGTTVKVNTNGTIEFEGDTADAYETTISVTDPTADRSIVIPNAGGTVMTSSLATNGADAANAVTGASNGLVYEGATANDYETTLSATDPTADRAIVLPNAAGTVVLGNQAATQTFTIMTTTINGILRNIPAY